MLHSFPTGPSRPWLPDAARDAIETWALDGTLDLTRLLELVFAKLEGDVCDFVLSWIQGVFNWNVQGM